MKRFFNKIVLFIKTLFADVDTWIHEHVQPSIEITNKLIAILESPVTNIITALIPGDADDKLKDFVLVYLHKAIDAMYISADIVNEPDWTIKVVKMLDYAKSLSPEMRTDFWRGLARNLALQSAGNPTDVKGKSINLLIEMQLNKTASGLHADDLPDETIVNGNLVNTLYANPSL